LSGPMDPVGSSIRFAPLLLSGRQGSLKGQNSKI